MLRSGPIRRLLGSNRTCKWLFGATIAMLVTPEPT